MSRIAQLEKMLAAEPGDAFVLYGLAQEYAKAGEMARAVEVYDRCLAADPGYCYAYYHKARAQEALGRVDDAAATLRAGVEAARRAGDAHAEGEIRAYLDELSP
jgi:tetratricopeptide (TPR) repeat protein